MATSDTEAATAKAVGILNGLLRGEIAAVETYQQAVRKAESAGTAASLKPLHEAHVLASEQLRSSIQQLDGVPDSGSGAWGFFARTVEGTATLLGNAAALAALRQGEQHGVSAYETAAADDRLPAECRTLIQTRLLPQTRAHLTALDALSAGV